MARWRRFSRRRNPTVLDGTTVKRSVEVSAPTYLYTGTDMFADFGTLPSAFTVRVAQVSAVYAEGTPLERIINV